MIPFCVSRDVFAKTIKNPFVRAPNLHCGEEVAANKPTISISLPWPCVTFDGLPWPCMASHGLPWPPLARCRQVRYKGTFVTPMGFQFFPYDCQTLLVRLRAKQERSPLDLPVISLIARRFDP